MPSKAKLTRRNALSALADQIAILPDGEDKARRLAEYLRLKGRRKAPAPKPAASVQPEPVAVPAFADGDEYFCTIAQDGHVHFAGDAGPCPLCQEN